MNGSMERPLAGKTVARRGLRSTSFRRLAAGRDLSLVCLVAGALCLVVVAEALQDQQAAPVVSAGPQQQPSIGGDQQRSNASPAPSSGAINLEDLNNIVQQYNEASGPTTRQLANDIIARLMVDNLTGASWRPSSELGSLEAAAPSEPDSQEDSYELEPQQQQQQVAVAPTSSAMSGPDIARLRKLMSMVQSYEMNAAADDGHGVFQYASLPISEAATMKRAKMLLMRQQQGGRMSPYSRGSFDFGLGKRGQLLQRRIADAEYGAGKRLPASSHRFDFGLGKRVVSPSYPRFDFGLGKRSPANRNRFDFGLGRK